MTNETKVVAGIKVPDSAMAKAAAELVRDTETDLLSYATTRKVAFEPLPASDRTKDRMRGVTCSAISVWG